MMAIRATKMTVSIRVRNTAVGMDFVIPNLRSSLEEPKSATMETIPTTIAALPIVRLRRAAMVMSGRSMVVMSNVMTPIAPTTTAV